MKTLKHETIDQRAKWKHVHDVHGNNNVSFKDGFCCGWRCLSTY
jgi:hypothetical protein